MSRPLEVRLDLVEGTRNAAAAEQGSAALRRRYIWRAEVAMGAVIRSALARAGVDPAEATRLCVADEAAASLAALPDRPELQRAGRDGDDAAAAAETHDRAPADAFEPKLVALVQRFAGAPPPDFAKASFAELFAWALAQPAAE